MAKPHGLRAPTERNQITYILYDTRARKYITQKRRTADTTTSNWHRKVRPPPATTHAAGQRACVRPSCCPPAAAPPPYRHRHTEDILCVHSDHRSYHRNAPATPSSSKRRQQTPMDAPGRDEADRQEPAAGVGKRT